MAMMMTGRVLLVCALCVLWCGGLRVNHLIQPPDPSGLCVQCRQNALKEERRWELTKRLNSAGLSSRTKRSVSMGACAGHSITAIRYGGGMKVQLPLMDNRFKSRNMRSKMEEEADRQGQEIQWGETKGQEDD
ncbi:hypothetical protein TcBrA4_0139610 [Trypanosoma cruzi]|nr:hypothetical protein TcBrA4_0139610 [Trypanosoma cruzi]